MSGPIVNVSGCTFGRLTAIRWIPRRGWECRCECGNLTVVRSTYFLTSGEIKTCGCVHPGTRHGMTDSPTYSSWKAMRRRCESKAAKWSHCYALRGIGCCSEWRSFEAFLADMGERPDGTTLDRIDNESGYSKANCRWATGKQQSNNRRNTLMLTAFGETKALTDWLADSRCPVDKGALYSRVRLGWSHHDAITTPAWSVHLYDHTRTTATA